MVQSLPKRSDVKVEETWNLKDLYATEEDYNNTLEEIEKASLCLPRNLKAK